MKRKIYKLVLDIHLSDDEFNLLKEIEKCKYAEYRDTEYESKEDFLKSPDYLQHNRSLEWFMCRNFNGTYYLLNKLVEYNLIETDFDAWHITYTITDLGKLFIKQNSNEVNYFTKEMAVNFSKDVDDFMTKKED
jgi:hypothetical protein